MRLFRTLMLAATIVSCACAEGIHGRITGGTTIFADDGAVYEATLGGSMRLYLSRRWSIEPEFLHARKRSDRNSFLWGNLSFDFRQRDRQIVPYFHAAPGLVRHTSEFGPFSFSNTEAAFGTGAGVRFKLSDRVFIAPQFRTGLADGVFVEFT